MTAVLADADPLAGLAALRAADPAVRAVDAAARLGLSEGALAELRRRPEADPGTTGTARRLRPAGAEGAAILEALRPAGPVMTLTRNPAAVHETTGRIGEVEAQGLMGQAVGPIDLRLFLRWWHAAYAVTEPTRSGPRRSVQVFDPAGAPVIKIFAADGHDPRAWEAAVARMEDRAAAPAAFDAAPEGAPEERPDAEIDVAALREGWLGLGHTHDFFGLLRRLGVARRQALRLGGADLARRAPPGMLTRVLEAAAGAAVPIMVFVGNRGCMQIFSGPVRTIRPTGPWINVLDPGFNLHARTDLIAEEWLVTKPTAQRGPITALEGFDAEGRLVVQVFGVRAAGGTEREDWRALVTAAAEGAA